MAAAPTPSFALRRRPPRCQRGRGPELGATLATSGLELVYEGSQVGMMGTVADATLQHGGEVFGVLTESLAARGIAHLGITRLAVMNSMHERKGTRSRGAMHEHM